MKTKTVYCCQSCGAQRPKWQGQCSDCGAWNTYVEETFSSEPTKQGWSIGSAPGEGTKPVNLSQEIEARILPRISTGFSEFDRVLGGGVVPGSFILLGGDPGIGKSTLLMQMAGGLARSQKKILYVSGEESVDQTALRAQRLGVKNREISVASESNLDQILKLVQEIKPEIMVVDSIQTIYMPELSSAAGTVSQVRECAGRLMSLAKNEGISVFLIGHVTKDGHIAGPKTLEHMVDTVLSFEGDSNYQYRLLRSLKNRFGSAFELGVFQMDSRGLKEVLNPSEMFLEERGQHVSGSAVFAAIEGSRPLLCEVQALSVTSPMAMPRRTAIGWDSNRLHVLTAVLDKHLQLDFAHKDIFVNVVGGLKLSEPAADLAVAAALLSSYRQAITPAQTCFFGEIGLTGEVRTVPLIDLRIREANKLGFTGFVAPSSARKQLSDLPESVKKQVTWVSNVLELNKIFSKPLTKIHSPSTSSTI